MSSNSSFPWTTWVQKIRSGEAKESAARWWEREKGGHSKLAALREERVQELWSGRREGEDPFGLSRETFEKGMKWLGFFYRNYFRCQLHGAENVPDGPCLLVSNHSGILPWDGAMICAALFYEREHPLLVRALVDRRVDELKWVAQTYREVGHVIGTPENAELLLARGETLLVFPEGVKAICKPSRERYQLQNFGTGFVRLALKMGIPIVPVAVVGAEFNYYNFGNSQWMADLFQLPAFPLSPQMLLPGGQLPLPVPYKIEIGEPRMMEGTEHNRESWVRGTETVKQEISRLIQQGLSRK